MKTVAYMTIKCSLEFNERVEYNLELLNMTINHHR
jgi:hypothetical protein